MLWNHVVSLAGQVFPNIVATVVTVPVMFVWHHRQLISKVLDKIEESGEKTREHVTQEVGNNAESCGEQAPGLGRGEQR